MTVVSEYSISKYYSALTLYTEAYMDTLYNEQCLGTIRLVYYIHSIASNHIMYQYLAAIQGGFSWLARLANDVAVLCTCRPFVSASRLTNLAP